jgi:hypothetical protein
MAILQPITKDNTAAPDNLQILAAAAADDATREAGRNCPPLSTSTSCFLNFHINFSPVHEVYKTADLLICLMNVRSLQWKSGKFLLAAFKKKGSRGMNKKLVEYVFPQCLL